jgi:hypothetical protein
MQGMTTVEAIDYIAAGYHGWGKKYRSSRPEWVARLQKWEQDHKKDRQTWTNAHHSHTQLWKAKYPSAAAKKIDNGAAEPAKKKARV